MWCGNSTQIHSHVLSLPSRLLLLGGRLALGPCRRAMLSLLLGRLLLGRNDAVQAFLYWFISVFVTIKSETRSGQSFFAKSRCCVPCAASPWVNCRRAESITKTRACLPCIWRATGAVGGVQLSTNTRNTSDLLIVAPSRTPNA